MFADAINITQNAVQQAVEATTAAIESYSDLALGRPINLDSLRQGLTTATDSIFGGIRALGTAPGQTADQVQSLTEALTNSIDNLSRVLPPGSTDFSKALGDVALDLHRAVRSAMPNQSISDNLQNIGNSGYLLSQVSIAYINAPDGSLRQQALGQAARVLVADMQANAIDIFRSL